MMPLHGLIGAIPRRWVGIHKSCTKEAFSYAHYDKPEKPWLGALIYHRGKRPYELTQEYLDGPGLWCESCGVRITKEDEMSPAPEIFKVKSMMRFMQSINDWYLASQSLAQSHVRVLEYGYILGIKYEDWKVTQDGLDKNLEFLQGLLEKVHEHCAVLGDCSQAHRPTQIIGAKGRRGLRVDEESGEAAARAIQAAAKLASDKKD